MKDIYRIIHVSNLEQILLSGKLICANHPDASSTYRGIGNNSVIDVRNKRPIPIQAERTFRDYIGFYFGNRSIMLLNIKTGYGEVEMISQEEIIYLVLNLSSIKEHEYEFFFTDGHALQYPTTQFFDDLESLPRIDFTAAMARDFSAAAEMSYPDLKRRKQAEFHVYNELQVDDLKEIVVFNSDAILVVQRLLDQVNSKLTVRCDSSYYFM